MVDYLEMGSVPADEDCAQVGTEDYEKKAVKECRRFAAGILNLFGQPPEGAGIGIKKFPHDFGHYFEVVVHYENDVEEAMDYAYKVEMECPGTWAELEKVVG